MILVGLVRELDHDPSLPSIHDMIHKPTKEKSRIINYMKKSEVIAVAPAIVRDILNRKRDCRNSS